MKRFIFISYIIAITLLLSLISSASAFTGNTIDLDHYTIEFQNGSSFTAEVQQVIAQHVTETNNSTSTSTTYNLLCTLFGHKTSTETISVIEHRVSNTQPRCIQSYQDVTACSRCDYVYIEEISSIYIYCCD